MLPLIYICKGILIRVRLQLPSFGEEMGAQIPILTTVQTTLISGIGKGQEVQRTFFYEP
jgi:hypothetical protein